MKINIVNIVVFLGVIVASGSASYIRLLHACPFLLGSQSLAVNGSVIITEVGISKVSQYEFVPPGLVRLSIPSGVGDYVTSQVNLNPETHYTVAVIGQNKASLKVMIDTISAEEESPLVRVVSLAPLHVDLKLYFNLELFTTVKANEMSLGFSYRKAVGGNYTLSLMGMTGGILCVKQLKAMVGKAYSIYIVPSNCSNTFVHLLVVEDVVKQLSPTVNIRVFHASVQLIPPIDLVVNGRVILGGVTYGRTSIYAMVNVAKADLQVKLSGSSKIILEMKQISFLGGNHYTIVVYGENEVYWKLLVDAVLPFQTCSLYRLSHVSESLQVPQIVSSFNRPLLSLVPNPLKFGDSTNFVSTCSSSISLSIAPALSSTTTSMTFKPPVGRASSLFIIGSTTSNSRPLRVMSIDNPTHHLNVEVESAVTANIEMGVRGLSFIL